MTEPLLVDLQQLSVNDHVLVSTLQARVEPGQCLVVMGASGSGKSSLLGWMAGTLDPAFQARGSLASGTERLDALPPERRRLGLLFQDDLLFPHLSVGGNLAFALPAAVRPRAERQRRIEAALADAGLAEPRALLLDEPFGKLDTALRQAFRGWVFEHARERGLPMVLVTHDHADAQAALEACGGRLVQLGD